MFGIRPDTYRTGFDLPDTELLKLGGYPANMKTKLIQKLSKRKSLL
jgi:hypothetical protein